MTSTEGYTTESIALAVAPKVPALLSLAGSIYIVWSVLSAREKRGSIYHRLMLGLSVSDILSSHIYFLGTWLIPRGSSGPFGDVYMAFGTFETCQYSGFFNQLAIASPLYNVSLSIYYFLHIQRGWKENALKKVEPAFHIIPLVFAFGTAITAAVGEMYGNVFWTCWINPDPPQPYFQYFQWSFLFGPVWVCILIQLSVMVTLWWTMRKQERLISRKYELKAPTTATIPAETNGTRVRANRRKRQSINDEGKYSSRIAVQGSLYVLVFCITWFFPTVQRISELANGQNYFAIQALDTTLLPLQGFFNVLIYMRPKYTTYRRKYPDLTVGTILKIIHDPKVERKLVTEFRSMHTRARDRRSTTGEFDFDGQPNIPEEMESGNIADGGTESNKTNKSEESKDIKMIESKDTRKPTKTSNTRTETASDTERDVEMETDTPTTVRRIDMVGRIQSVSSDEESGLDS
mmetsp:Transcript_22506/g.55690  ORF Transcript_22506/g.55690 Transcript_22506/m.55690 type:complete len:462 (-) Transcript_22506:89-1474(-)